MVEWSPARRALPLGAALGAIAGGMEMVKIGSSALLSVSWPAAFVLALLAVLAGAGVGLVFGAGLGLLSALTGGEPGRRSALGMGLTGVALGFFYTAPAIAEKLEQGLPVAAAFLACAQIGVFGIIYFNAGYWFRREAIGERRRWGFTKLAPLLGLGLALVGALRLGARDFGSSAALESDPSVILVTIGGVGAAELGAQAAARPVGQPPPAALAGVAAGSPTPHIDAMAVQGVIFTEAISPAPQPALAAAAALTGLHPLRLGLASEGHRLGLGAPTLAERLRGEGYAAGAALSWISLQADSGLDRGFEAYDDQLWTEEGAPAGLEALRLAQVIAAPLAGLLGPDSGLLRRGDAATVAAALAWLGRVGPRPALLWVHLSGPATASALGHGEALRAADAAVGALRAGVDAWRGERPVFWIVAGTGGRAPGGEALGGLSEAVVHVPLVILPSQLRAARRVVPEAVRLTDLSPTVLDQLNLKPAERLEGADLLGFAEGVKDRGYATLLYRRPAEGPAAWGYRAPTADGKNTLKLVILPGGDRLFDLAADPLEAQELRAEQPEAAAALRALIEPELRAAAQWPTAGPRAAGLRAAVGAP